MFGLGPMEIALIAFLGLLIFGPSQLPKLGKSLGDTVKSFREVGKEIERGHEDD